MLSTDLNLTKDEVQNLRDRWNEQARGLHQGGVPILTSGLKVLPWTQPALGRDMQIAELLKLTSENVALVFRVPLQVLGIGSAPFSSTQTLMGFWLASGLGFALNHIEEAFGVLFGLRGPPDEYVEFDTSALLRSDQKDRIEGLARAVMSGIMSPNEARNQEGFDDVPYGDEPRLQAQVVPLSAAAGIPAAPASPAAPAAAKNYKAAVQSDVEELRVRARRPERVAARFDAKSPFARQN